MLLTFNARLKMQRLIKSLCTTVVFSLCLSASAEPTTRDVIQPGANPAPVNEKCPVSGADVNPEATAQYEGRTVAFCCNNCKAKFVADPAKFAGKLPEVEADAPCNEKCPVSGAAVNAGFVSTFEGKTVGFCCNKCKGTFDADPAKFKDKIVAKGGAQ